MENFLKNQLLRHYRLQYFSRWKDFEKRTKLCVYTQSPGEVMESMCPQFFLNIHVYRRIFWPQEFWSLL